MDCIHQIVHAVYPNYEVIHGFHAFQTNHAVHANQANHATWVGHSYGSCNFPDRVFNQLLDEYVNVRKQRDV